MGALIEPKDHASKESKDEVRGRNRRTKTKRKMQRKKSKEGGQSFEVARKGDAKEETTTLTTV